MNSDDNREMCCGSASPSPFHPPAVVSIMSTFSTTPRRLSSHFIPFTEPVRSERQPSYISDRVGEFGPAKDTENGVVWEMFSPIQSVLALAVFAVVSANSEKNKIISELRESVQLRDLVLSAMQEELDDLCELVNYFKDLPDTMCGIASTKNVDDHFGDSFSGNVQSVSCGCQSCVYHQLSSNDSMLPLMNVMTPEERRMSSLSDWAPSVNSSVDIQLQLDTEQDIYNLRKECDEKDTTIKELSEIIHSSEVVNSKRIAELENIIRKKKGTITKLKKEMATLEQKVSYLTRLRRPSSSSSSSARVKQHQVLVDNFVYDADSASSSSSSDSDCSPRNSSQACNAKTEEIIVQDSKYSLLGDARSPHILSKLKQPHSVYEDHMIRRRLPTKSKNAILQK